MPDFSSDEKNWQTDSRSLPSIQLNRLNSLLSRIRLRPFYKERLEHIKLPLASLSQMHELPLLCKEDLIPSSPTLPARIFDLPTESYTRLHQTSGTSGWPLSILDTPSDWKWWLTCWQYVLRAARVTHRDVAMMAFSFGPFIGFWTANDAMIKARVLVVPGGGLSSEARLKMIADYRCTVLCCTPTYALHLIAVAQQAGFDLTETQVSRIIVAGEPGGSMRSARERIEQAWDATVIDHSGASELGAWGFGSKDGRGLHVIEPEFIAEILDFSDGNLTGNPVADGQLGELVLTNLGRLGGPAIRYRTGDMVRGFRDHDQPCPYLWLSGGVIGRSDDMIVIRGVNIFPSSIETIVREIEPAAEHRMIVTRAAEMDQLRIEVEGSDAIVSNITNVLRNRLALRIEVVAVEKGSLPRFEAKSRRLVDRR